MGKGFNADTKMGTLLDDAASEELLYKFIPDLKNAGPMIKIARGMTLRAIASYPQAKLSSDKLRDLVSELEKL